MTKTLIAIPAMETVATRFMMSLVCMKRIGASRVSVVSDSLVYHARNILAAEAIDDGCDQVLWLDSDMVFMPDIMEQLHRDINAGVENTTETVEYVSALFFKRRLPTEPVIYKNPGRLYLDYPNDALFPIAGSGFGAVMTTTKLLKDIYDRFGPPFNPLPDGTGEDVAFCRRARELGYTLWCDSRVKVSHVGSIPIGEEHYRRQTDGT